MSIAEKKSNYSHEEYLALEKENDFKSQYYQGEIFGMSGGTANHSRISINSGRELSIALRGKDCDVFNSDLMVRIEAADAFVYPDLSVVCGKEDFYKDNTRILLNPTIIVEVLSETTERFDRGSKFRKYQTIPSLKEYVLIDQWEAQIDVFRPIEDGKWELTTYSGLDGLLKLESISVEIPLIEIYRRVNFSES